MSVSRDKYSTECCINLETPLSAVFSIHNELRQCFNCYIVFPRRHGLKVHALPQCMETRLRLVNQVIAIASYSHCVLCATNLKFSLYNSQRLAKLMGLLYRYSQQSIQVIAVQKSRMAAGQSDESSLVMAYTLQLIILIPPVLNCKL